MTFLERMQKTDESHPQYESARKMADLIISMYGTEERQDAQARNIEEQYKTGEAKLPMSLSFDLDVLTTVLRKLGAEIGSEIDKDDPGEFFSEMFDRVFRGEKKAKEYNRTDEEEAALYLAQRFIARWFREQGFRVTDFDGLVVVASW